MVGLCNGGSSCLTVLCGNGEGWSCMYMNKSRSVSRADGVDHSVSYVAKCLLEPWSALGTFGGPYTPCGAELELRGG